MDIMYDTSNTQTVFCFTEEGFKSLCDSEIDRDIVLKLPREIQVEIPWGLESLKISGNTHAVLNSDVSAFAEDHSYIVLNDHSSITATESVTVEMHGNSVARVLNGSNVTIISNDLVIKVCEEHITTYFNFEEGEVFNSPS